MNRTQEEIVERIEYLKDEDVFGFQTSLLVGYLDYAHAKAYLVDGTTEQEWEEARDKESPKEKMIDYLEFAFSKAQDKRGLSAGRSIAHYMAWLWLDGNEELAQSIEDYDDYGIPQLLDICAYLEVNAKQFLD